MGVSGRGSSIKFPGPAAAYDHCMCLSLHIQHQMVSFLHLFLNRQREML